MKDLLAILFAFLLIFLLLFTCSDNFKSDILYIIVIHNYAKDYCRNIYHTDSIKLTHGIISYDKDREFGWCKLPDGTVQVIDELSLDYFIFSKINVHKYPQFFVNIKYE
jgi:hypothetical protein